MKSLLLSIFITITTLTFQAQNIEGIYANKWVANSGEGIEYILSLQEDGNFTFDYIRMYMDNNTDKNIKVKGTWKLENHLLVLNAEASGDENQIAAGLHLNKARFVSVSPRNPKFNLVKPSLKFYASDVFYAKDMELIKTESTVSSIE